MIDGLLTIAQAEVGVREVGGNNCGARVRDYQRATDLRPLGDWPWRAAFVSWVTMTRDFACARANAHT